MSNPNPTKRLPTTRINQLVMIRDESDEWELLAFENADAAYLFEACLKDSGYGSAYGGYETDEPNMNLVRQTQGYKNWLAGGQRVITLAYMNYVSQRMDADEECDVSGDLLNMETVSDAYVEMNVDDWEMLYPEECESYEDFEEELTQQA